MIQLQDDDRMPFGKYKGHPMADVPAQYLHFLWTDPRDPMKNRTKTDRVADYIERNLAVLKKEHEDGIW